MSRFGSLVFAGACCVALALGCGDKDLPSDPNATGGVVTGGGETATGGTTVTPQGGEISPGTDGGTTPATGGTTVPTGPVYANDIELFLTKYCASCHSAAGGVPPEVDTYAGAKDGAVASNKTLIEATMPPRNKTQPTAAEKTRFADWVKAGFPQ